MAEKSYQVIIVGGGPVGVGWAMELGLCNITGVSVAIAEHRLN